MRKKFLTIFAFALTLFAFFGCNNYPAGSEPDDPNALVIMGKRTDMEKSYIQKIFNKYKSEKGSIKVIEIEDSEFEEEAARRFAVGEGPDIFFHFHNDDLNRLNVSGNFIYMNDEEWVDDLTPSSKNYCTDSEGNLLGLPFWESSVSGCYYNKELFKYCGLHPAHKQSDFDELCKEISKQNITPICWPANGCSWMYQFALDPIFADAPDGPELLKKLNANEISYADIPAVKDMVKWVKDAQEKGWFGDNFLEKGWDDISADLNSGNAAMVFIWDTWFYTDFVGGKYSKEDFALMPVFMNTVKGGTYEGGNLNMMMANKNSPRLEKALEFIRFCAQPENYNMAFEGISTVSCFKGQTTNIQSHMITDDDTATSIGNKERVSTASTKISGYNADDVASAFNKLFRGEIDVDGCIALMDQYRIAKQAK